MEQTQTITLNTKAPAFQPQNIDRFRQFQQQLEEGKIIGFKIPGSDYLYRYLEDGCSWKDEFGNTYHPDQFEEEEEEEEEEDEKEIPSYPDEGDIIPINRVFSQNEESKGKSAELIPVQDIYVDLQNGPWYIFFDNVPKAATIGEFELCLIDTIQKNQIVEIVFYLEDDSAQETQKGFVQVQSLEVVQLLANVNGKQFKLGTEGAKSYQLQFYLQNEVFPVFPTCNSFLHSISGESSEDGEEEKEDDREGYVIKTSEGKQVFYESDDADQSDESESFDEDEGEENDVEYIFIKSDDIAVRASKIVNPPYELFFYKIPLTTTRADVEEFFKDVQSNIQNIRFYPDPQGQFQDRSGVVIFDSQDALISSAKKNGTNFLTSSTKEESKIKFQIKKAPACYFRVTDKGSADRDDIAQKVIEAFQEGGKPVQFRDFTIVPLQREAQSKDPHYLKVDSPDAAVVVEQYFQESVKDFTLEVVRAEPGVLNQFQEIPSALWKFEFTVGGDQSQLNIQDHLEDKKLLDDARVLDTNIEFQDGKATGSGHIIVSDQQFGLSLFQNTNEQIVKFVYQQL